MSSTRPIQTLYAVFTSTILCFGITAFANADIIISLDSSGATTVDTGSAGVGKIINVFIGQDAASSDDLLGLTVDFDFSSGAVTGGTVAATGAGAPAGFFGAGNLTVSDFSFIPARANIDQEFSDGMQPLSNAPLNEKWAEIELDTTGLANGTYTFQVRDPANSFIDSVGGSVASNRDFSFTVSSVPEPGSVALLFGLGLGGLLTRRRVR